MPVENADRAIRGEATVAAPLDKVWKAWTTKEGIQTFFGPDCNVELRVDGAYEIFFDLEAPPGQKGGEGMRILALQPKKMLAVTWNAPPHLPNVRGQQTHVVIRFRALGEGQTKVTLTHDGWGEGAEWDEAWMYFTRAWNEVVLPRFVHRFTVGPIDWSNPPDLRGSPAQAAKGSRPGS
jgi:uncharacterized protein YndB with AHSA1/START domain